MASAFFPGVVRSKALFSGLFVLILGVASIIETTGYAAVGRTAGTFAVSPVGTANYSIPIWAPPGPNGLQPNISLTYNSGLGNGYAGVGWSITGLSSITRCDRTYAQDGVPAPVTLTTTDAFCLDGQRLQLTSGTYGLANSTYQTEIADFSNVTAHGTAGNGPSYFVVQRKDGRTYTYGNTTDSRILATGTATALNWLLNAVQDPAGNTMTIAYTTRLATGIPRVISWTPTGHGASTYSYTMGFTYNDNVAQGSTSGYTAGTYVSNTKLLAAISINYGAAIVKMYALSYTLSATTGRQQLTQILECTDGTESNCLTPTTFQYQPSSAAGIASIAGGSIAAGLSTATQCDFNGDGRSDLGYTATTGTYYVALNSGVGYGTAFNANLTGVVACGDLLGTGTDGLLANNGGTLYYYLYNSSTGTFQGTSTGLAYNAAYSQYTLADLDGDGLPDLVALNGFSVVAARNSSQSGVASFSPPWTTAYTASVGSLTQAALSANSLTHPGRSRKLDFNGDGREDLFLQYTQVVSGTTTYLNYELISNGASTTMTPLQLPNSATQYTAFFTNWNSDQCTDVALGITVYISGCNGSVPTTLTLPAGTNVIAAMDWDGDGRTDLVTNNAGTLGVYLSTGSGISTLHTTSILYQGTSVRYYVLDVNADGLDDLALITNSSPTLTFWLHNGSGLPPDLLTSAKDGYGNSVSPTYISLAQGSGTAFFPRTDAVSGYTNYLGPLYVVNNVSYSDPSSTTAGATYQQSNFYAGAWMSLQGRGFAGFEAHQTLDSRNGVWETWNYLLAFPYTGMLNYDTQSQNNTQSGTIFWRQLTSTDIVLSSTMGSQRYFPYASAETVLTNEVGGTKNVQLIRTTSTSYAYDDFGNATGITTTVTDNDNTSPYNGSWWTTSVTNTPDPDTSTGCLNLLSASQVTYTSSVGAAVTRTRNFTPDLTNCRYTAIVTEPSSGTYTVTENLGYDSFGNINSDQVIGAGMTARTTSITWSNTTYTTGQFPLSITDASGATTQVGYNYSFGVPTGVTDPNGETTSWQYGDGFGRKTQETRPDGTSTQWTYNDCSASGACLIGTHTANVQFTVFNADSSILTDGTTLYDPLERPYLSNKRMLAGGTYDRNEVRFDSLGRQIQQAAPCTWTALATPCPYWTTTRYDMLNRPTQVQRPVNSANSSLQTTGYQYAGDTTTITDPQGNPKILIKDPNGWLRETKDAYEYTVTLGYDAAGSKTSVTDSLGNTLWSTGPYAYGIKPFLLGFTDMDRGHWVITPDALGETTGWTDGNSQHHSMTYDALSRPLTRTEPDYYTQWTWGSSASNHNIGRLQSVCTGSSGACTSQRYSEGETYDSFGRLYQRAITIPNLRTFTYTWQYSTTTGLLDTLTYPISTSTYALQLKYAYSNGYLSSVTDISDSPNVTISTANTMDAAGHLTQETLGNGIVVSRAFDAVTQWLAFIQAGVSGGTLVQNQSFLYDELGNVTQRQDNSNLSLTENVYYDNDYRLTSTKLNGTQNLSITYDNTMGNITSRSDVAGGATWTYSATQKHAVTQAGSSAYTYGYAPNGVMSTRQGQTIHWTSYELPDGINAGSGSTAETVNFSYGPTRQRWLQSYTGNGTTEFTYYVGDLLEIAAIGGVNDFRHYIYGANGTPVAVYSRKTSGVNTLSYLLSDHQSGVAKITNSSGAVVLGESFTPFGNRRNPSSWSGSASNSDLTTAAGITRQGYTFQTQLGLWMGLNHMNGRVEDAITGRFLSADPNIPDLSNTQDYNRYTYVDNNPLTNADPSGFATCDSQSAECVDVGSFGGGNQSPAPYCGDDCTQTVATCYVCLQPGPPPLPDFLPNPPKTIFPGPQGNLPIVTVTAPPCANSSGQGVLIQLGFTNANSSNMAIPRANHTFVIASDPTTGASYASRGGPGSGGAGPPGSGSWQLVGASGPYNASFRDYGSVTGVQTVGYVNAPYSQVTALMDNFAAAVNNNGVPYLGNTNNSNSYAGALLGELGFWPPPTPAMNAPGYGQDYKPIPNLVCAKP